MRREEQPSTSKGPSSTPTAAASAANGSVATPSAATGEDSFAVRAPSINLPKGGGAINGIGEKFSANPVTGTGSMSVPIAVSPGRGGFAPQLALSYDSGAGNGPFGLGWGLSVPSITRKTDKGLPRYQDDSDGDTYLLAGAEDLVRLADADGRVVEDQTCVVYGRTFAVRCYRPRIEGLFARIERWSEHGQPSQVFWRTLTRDNMTSWFGRTDSSRVHDSDEPARIFQWHLCESHDDKGNVAVYQYQREDGAGVDRTLLYECNRRSQTALANTYLKRIFYGNRQPYLPTLAAAAPSGQAWQEPGMGAGDWMFEVVFDYGEHGAGTPQPAPVVQSHWPVRRDPFSISHRVSEKSEQVNMVTTFCATTGAGECWLQTCSNWADVLDNPGPGNGWFFTVDGEAVRGEGTLGATSAGTERIPAVRCP